MLRRAMLLAAPATLVGISLGALAAPARPPTTALPLCGGGLREVAASETEDAVYLERLGLLEGHLMIGRRLLDASQSRLAVPHFGHPIRELYSWLEPRMKSRGLAPFERELEQMESFAEGGGTGTGGAFAVAWTALTPKLAAAQAAIEPVHRDSQRFQIEHVAMMAYNVAGDYGESIERGRIVNIVEFHDSMGFLLYAAATAATAQARPGAPPEWAEVIAMLEDLRQAVYSDLLPASRPPQSVSAVRARYDRIRAVAARVSA